RAAGARVARRRPRAEGAGARPPRARWRSPRAAGLAAAARDPRVRRRPGRLRRRARGVRATAGRRGHHRGSRNGRRAARWRARPAERRVPWSLAIELCASLGAATGAAGVTSSAAETLVAMVPALRERFPGAATGSVEHDVGARRFAAIAELLAAVAEDKPLAV